MSADEYQERYLAHQKRKSEMLAELMAARHSDRVFAADPVDDETIERLVSAAAEAPSSCDRRGVRVLGAVTDRDGKALLGGLLVGGVGWVHRAPAVLLLMADPAAYKAPGEIGFMPYLDAGFAAAHVVLAAEAEGLRSCFINPNVRQHNRDHFASVFGPGLFCGAVAVGRPVPPEWVGDTS